MFCLVISFNPLDRGNSNQMMDFILPIGFWSLTRFNPLDRGNSNQILALVEKFMKKVSEFQSPRSGKF